MEEETEYSVQVIEAKNTTNIFDGKQMETKANLTLANEDVFPTRRDFRGIMAFAPLNVLIEIPAN